MSKPRHRNGPRPARPPRLAVLILRAQVAYAFLAAALITTATIVVTTALSAHGLWVVAPVVAGVGAFCAVLARDHALAWAASFRSLRDQLLAHAEAPPTAPIPALAGPTPWPRITPQARELPTDVIPVVRIEQNAAAS